MKKLFALLMTAALLLGLGACNSSKGKPQDPISSNTSAPEQTTSAVYPNLRTILNRLENKVRFMWYNGGALLDGRIAKSAHAEFPSPRSFRCA